MNELIPADGTYLVYAETARFAGARIVVTSGRPNLEISLAVESSVWRPVTAGYDHGAKEIHIALREHVLNAFVGGMESMRPALDAADTLNEQQATRIAELEAERATLAAQNAQAREALEEADALIGCVVEQFSTEIRAYGDQLIDGLADFHRAFAAPALSTPVPPAVQELGRLRRVEQVAREQIKWDGQTCPEWPEMAHEDCREHCGLRRLCAALAVKEPTNA